MIRFTAFFRVLMTMALGVGPSGAGAASLGIDEPALQDRAQTLPAASLDLKSEVNRVFTEMPAGYYEIATVPSLKSWLVNPDVVLVDVHEPSEYQTGHIPNAINVRSPYH